MDRVPTAHRICGHMLAPPATNDWYVSSFAIVSRPLIIVNRIGDTRTSPLPLLIHLGSCECGTLRHRAYVGSWTPAFSARPPMMLDAQEPRNGWAKEHNQVGTGRSSG